MGFNFKAFNPEQKKAVTHSDGPLLIVAGAGTGKTKVITGRILYLILEKKVKPENILALTFTEKAAHEMQERVDRELPLGCGECWIKTFHGFCDAILRECSHEIGLSTDYKLLSEVDQWMLMKKHIFRFELDYYRPLGNPQKFISSLLAHFSRLKDEDIKSDEYFRYAEDFKKRAMSDEHREEGYKMLEAAKAYAEYKKLLIEENAIDYGDLIVWTLRLLETRKSVLKKYQEKFRHILVDEFQDTNYAQNKLLFLLAEHQNLCAVGDDDQAIYKWRGASVANILNFEKQFPNARKIVLSKNYRSAQKILDVAYSVIRANDPHRLEVQLDIPKKLRAAGSRFSPKIESKYFTHYGLEVDYVVSEIEKLIEAGKPDAAILVRANSHAKPFLEALKKKRIHYQYMAEESLFTQPLVKDLVSLLRFLADPADDLSLFRILALPIWGFTMEFLLDLNRQAKRTHSTLYEVFRQILDNQLSIDSPQNLSILQNLLKNLILLSREHSVSLLIATFLDSPYGKTLATEEGFTRGDPLQKLADFSEKIREFELMHRTERVQEFVDYLALMEQAGEGRGFQGEIERDVPKILTIHASKGLEFDSVFLVNLVRDRFPSTNRREAIEIPLNLIPEKIPEADHHLEEERRLFYVGITRARENLHFTYSDYYEGKKLWKPSPFILQIEEFLAKRLKRLEPARPQVPEAEVSATAIHRVHRPILEHTISLSTLSYSQIDTFQTCPLKYRFRYLLSLPSLPSSALNFGICIHNTLRDFYKLLKEQAQGETLSIVSLEYEMYLKRLYDIYEKTWIPYGYDSRFHEQARKDAGWKSLEIFLETTFAAAKINNGKLKLPIALEQSFKLHIGNVFFNGRIDRLDQLDDGTYEVIDYKTGSSGRKSEIDKDLQLSLYALACRDSLNLPVSKLTLWFLEENVRISTTRDEKQLSALKQELLKIIDKLRDGDFAATPGHHCGYCDYRGICDYAMISFQKS